MHNLRGESLLLDFAAVIWEKLRPTRVFDTYWRYAVARQDLFMARVHGAPPPWTNDPVLAGHRFTNVYRASDRVSQYLIRHVQYGAVRDAESTVFRTLLFKLFNRIETWDLLEESFGEITWPTFDFDRYARVLDRAFSRGERLYSAAYIMPPPRLGAVRKHRNHLRLLEAIMRDHAPRRLAQARSLEQVFEILAGYPSLGAFLAFQFSIDLNYSELLDFSEMDFVVAGPGARSGIAKCFSDTGGLSMGEVIRAVAEIADQEFERRGLRFRTLWGRPLQLVDCQNLFCEVDKYARAAHPEVIEGSGRRQIKQRYRPRAAPLAQWYPPKWGISPTPLTA
jgi:hypothetical protein